MDAVVKKHVIPAKAGTQEHGVQKLAHVLFLVPGFRRDGDREER